MFVSNMYIIFHQSFFNQYPVVHVFKFKLIIWFKLLCIASYSFLFLGWVGILSNKCRWALSKNDLTVQIKKFKKTELLLNKLH